MDIGYLVPTDGKSRDASTYIPMDQLRSEIQNHCRAKHVLFIMDSCFSGTLLTRAATTDGAVADYLAQRGAYGITAGMANQPAVDGLFTDVLIEGLNGNADYDNNGYMTFKELGLYVEQNVRARNRNQTPDYGTMLGSGQFVFARKGTVASYDQADAKLKEQRARIEVEKKELAQKMAAFEAMTKKAEKDRIENERRATELEKAAAIKARHENEQRKLQEQRIDREKARIKAERLKAEEAGREAEIKLAAQVKLEAKLKKEAEAAKKAEIIRAEEARKVVVKTKAERREAEKARFEKERIKAEQKRLAAEKRRVEEEAKAKEQARILEKKKAEAKRLTEQQFRLEAQRKKAEEKRLAVEKKKAEEKARAKEQALVLLSKKKAEAKQLAAEKAKLEEEKKKIEEAHKKITLQSAVPTEAKNPVPFTNLNIYSKKKSKDRYEATPHWSIHDTKTGLEWFVGPDRDMSWKKAKTWAETLQTGGSNWRMPTVKELRDLYQKGAGSRNMDLIFHTNGWWLWAESKKKGLDFANGGTRSLPRRGASFERVFAVRKYQEKD